MSTRRVSATSLRSVRFHPAWLAMHGLIMIFGIVAVATLPASTPSGYVVGRVAPGTVVARSKLTYIDRIATRRNRALAAAAVQNVYQTNVPAAKSSLTRARQLFDEILAVLHRKNANRSTEQRQIQQILVRTSVYPSDGLPRLGARKWTQVRTRTLGLLTSSINVLKPFNNLGEQRAIQVLDSSLPNPSGDIARVVEDIFRWFITPTEVLNRKATDARIHAAQASVPNVVVPVSAGTTVVYRGQIITPAILQELQAVGIPSSVGDWRQRLGTSLFTLVLIVLMLWYLRAFYTEVTGNQLLMLLMDATIIICGVAAKIVIPGHSLLPYFFPVAGAAALTGLLISSEVGVALAVVLALLIGWLVGDSFSLTAFYLLTGVAGAMSVRQLKRLNDFLVVGASIAITGGLLIAAFHLLYLGAWTPMFLRDYAAAAGFNGLISGALAFGGFVLLGNSFGVTTTLHLLELGHPDQKLLRRLMADAPGTYNHSLVVASMVERAAGEIDANVLLARVMALYHDVGKVANPLCFIENQIGTSNIHDDLKPRESAEIIRAHVTHGVVLARQHRLPVPIRDAILQHHGTMTMSYFFHRALEEDPNIDAEIFTYPGPRPRTKEVALLMMADGCEGAVRAQPTKSPETVRDTVDRIIDERVAGGQLSQCNLTLRDLAAARSTFVEVLNGIYHPRVEYPSSIRPSAAVGEIKPQ